MHSCGLPGTRGDVTKDVKKSLNLRWSYIKIFFPEAVTNIHFYGWE